MKRNVGTVDRTIRLVIGISCIALVISPTQFIDNEVIRVFVAVFGLGNLIVGLVVFCPLYILADINTNRGKSGQSKTPSL